MAEMEEPSNVIIELTTAAARDMSANGIGFTSNTVIVESDDEDKDNVMDESDGSVIKLSISSIKQLAPDGSLVNTSVGKNNETVGKAANPDGNQIIKVKIFDGEKNFFMNIPKTVKLGKVMRAYCRTRKVNPKECLFYFNIHRIKVSDTPLSIGLTEGDYLDVFKKDN